MADPKTDKIEAKTERRKPSNIPHIFQMGDIEAMRNEFRSIYGHEISAQFANDLKAFVEKAVKGDYSA